MIRVAIFLILLAQGAPPPKPSVTYFPTRVIDTYPRSDDFIVHWFSGVLANFNEPSLYQPADAEKNESYRFTYLRSFHEAVVIRMTVQPEGTGELHVKRGPRRKD